MPRPKKEALSPAVGTVNVGRKSGNPDFVSSSFYVPKKVNLRFNSALNVLKAEGFDLDRSDILSVLMDRFAAAVTAIEQADGEMDLQAILATTTDGSVEATADVSVLKGVISKQAAEMSQMHQTQIDELQRLLSEMGEHDQMRLKLAKRQMDWMTKQGIPQEQQLQWMQEQGIDPEKLSQVG